MSERYVGAWEQAGLFNPLNAPTPGYYLYNLFSWGVQPQGQLGLGNITSYSSPKQVGSLTNWLKISAGDYHVIALKTNGTLWTWGANNTGQLGLGNRTNYSSPKQVGVLTNWSDIRGGDSFCHAIKTDGTLWAWGVDGVGELGLGNKTYYSSPKQVGALTNWNTLCSNFADTTFGIKTDGTLWGWGSNFSGQLGIGNVTNKSSPTQVGSLANWKLISSLYCGSVAAIKTDGTLWCWGSNNGGQLGLGNTTNYSSPKQVGSLTNWAMVTGVVQYSFLAIKTDGTLWGWGYNQQGVLGLGNTTQYSSPVQVGSLTNWLYVAGGYSNVLAVKTDGTLWAWGQNNNGALGLNNTTSYSSPKQVGTITTWSKPSLGYTTAFSLG